VALRTGHVHAASVLHELACGLDQLVEQLLAVTMPAPRTRGLLEHREPEDVDPRSNVHLDAAHVERPEAVAWLGYRVDVGACRPRRMPLATEHAIGREIRLDETMASEARDGRCRKARRLLDGCVAVDQRHV